MCKNASKKQTGKNFCTFHHWANEQWLVGGKDAAMISAIAFRDTPLREELRTEGLWNYPTT
jgi:hypothetical protein